MNWERFPQKAPLPGGRGRPLLTKVRTAALPPRPPSALGQTGAKAKYPRLASSALRKGSFYVQLSD